MGVLSKKNTPKCSRNLQTAPNVNQQYIQPMEKSFNGIFYEIFLELHSLN